MKITVLTRRGLLLVYGLGGAMAAVAADEPRVERRVAEDDQVRIEELRVRGETQRVAVQPKMPGAREYEILMPRGAADPSQRRTSAAGERVWRVLSF